jgi:hypothetical protein
MKIEINESKLNNPVVGLHNLYGGVWISDTKVIVIVADNCKPFFSGVNNRWAGCLIAHEQSLASPSSSNWDNIKFTPFKGSITITAP